MAAAAVCALVSTCTALSSAREHGSVLHPAASKDVHCVIMFMCSMLPMSMRQFCNGRMLLCLELVRMGGMVQQ